MKSSYRFLVLAGLLICVAYFMKNVGLNAPQSATQHALPEQIHSKNTENQKDALITSRAQGIKEDTARSRVRIISAKIPRTSARKLSIDHESTEKLLTQKLGLKEPKFKWEGNLLIRIENTGALGKTSTSQNNQMIKDTAHAMIKVLAHDLGANLETTPLQIASMQQNTVSTQVTFDQTVSGVGMSNWGHVHLEFTPDGELISMDSSVLPNPVLANQKKLSPEQARNVGASMDPDRFPNSGDSSNTFREILWPVEVKSDSSKLIHAYEITRRGQKIVIDAESGKIVSQKDVRIF
jgi:hypothetical protein